MTKSFRIIVKGIVQGVGFRPFVFRLAKSLGLNGYVANVGNGVEIAVEGEYLSIQKFITELTNSHPPMSVIEEVKVEQIEKVGFPSFQVIISKKESMQTIPPPDLAICADCKRELTDPNNRRNGYPLISCMNCGPRFSILISMPYDRVRTTMRKFDLCKRCSLEYSDPMDRRFHAEPISCWDCGPKIWFVKGGKAIWKDPIGLAAREIDRGMIVAVKGIGGFHLAADATNEQAIMRLRRRKARHYKPFAIMARDMESLRSAVFVSEEEERWLRSHSSPIVLLKKRPRSPIANSVAPKLDELGVMLPYSGIHVILLQRTISPFLVMTSGNPKDEVIVHENKVALRKLSEMADSFLLHNRDILNFVDDSVIKLVEEKLILIRRSRGFVPIPMDSPVDVDSILALGADSKNTFSIGKGKRVFLSQHIGDLDSPPTSNEFLLSIHRLSKLFDMKPHIIAHDMHPGYISTSLAEKLGENRIATQHHHAHLASSIASNGIAEESIGLACDGTGYGPDGTSWGFELLRFNLVSYERLGHMRQFNLPGGNAAVLDPRRTAFSILLDSIGDDAFKLDLGLTQEQKKFISEMIRRKINSPIVSSCGRLFDAVSAMLGVCSNNTYDGEAAAELEAISDPDEDRIYPFDISIHEDFVFDYRPMISAIVDDLKNGVRRERIAGRFHRTLCRVMSEMVILASSSENIKRIALGGGSFVNRQLISGLMKSLSANGLQIYLPKGIPPNDGGLSYGQALIAACSR